MRLFSAKLNRMAKRISGMPGRWDLPAGANKVSKKFGAWAAWAAWARRVGILK